MIRFIQTAAIICTCFYTIGAEAQSKKYILAVHGGAGTILKSSMSPEKEQAYIQAITRALTAGYAVLKEGGSSLDAVETSVKIMEDDSLFNAGKGAVFTHEGRNELDASIMEGRTLQAGSVAGVTIIKNPISAARTVMEQSPHVMLAGQGAEDFARERGLTMVDPRYFRTEGRWQGLQRALKEDSVKAVLDHDGKTLWKDGTVNADYKFGTVGCVALDKSGNLAAATSTGGVTNKKYGRIGDSPIIGAGTYCDNNTAAVSCTGWGEFFIRTAAAKTIADLMEYKNYSPAKASAEVLNKLKKMGGSGGVIVLDRKGNMAMLFNTEGMYRGAVTEDGEIEVSLYR